MLGLLYFFIALICTFAGAITGMGGGVVIKPVLDLMGDFDSASIGALSSITVWLCHLPHLQGNCARKDRLLY